MHLETLQLDNQLPFLLALIRTPGLGPAKIKGILEKYSDLSAYFKHSSKETAPDWEGVEKDLQWREQNNCFIVPIWDPQYPALLKQIHNAPPILYVRGNLRFLNQPQIAMIGTRKPNPQAKELARQFGRHFSKAGLCITSGLAIGIDAASHEGALEETGSTLAVLGNGLDTVYPASHRNLALKIAEAGALVSEFPIGTPAAPNHFPRRNRIISGLSVGVLVVEAALKSGSLITARLALEQGREVFAIPGSIHNPLAKGCHALIREGAKLVETAEHVLEEIGALIHYVKGCSTIKPIEKSESLTLTKTQVAFLAHVDYECTSMDTIVMRSGLTASEVSSMLLELELTGYLSAVPGGYARLLN